MKQTNYMEVKFVSLSQNESFARVCAAAFAARLDPTLDDVADIKTAISEAVTNAVVHGYGDSLGEITLRAEVIDGSTLQFTVHDDGVGIADIDAAMQPFFTTAGTDDRSGMGFTVMQSFMDEVTVLSSAEAGTSIVMIKRLSQKRG